MLKKAGYRSSTALPIPFETGTTNKIEMALLQASDLYPVIRLTGDLDFGEVPAEVRVERMLSIHNDGDAELNVGGIVCPDGFTGSWSGAIAAGMTQDVVIAFEPTDVKRYTGEIVVLSDASIDTGKLGCSGTGVESTPSGIPVSWLAKYRLKTDGSDDDKDTDGDTHTTHQEWEADTIPTNRQSVLRFESAPIPLTGSRSLLRWQSVTTRSYDVERATNLVIKNAFQPIATGIPGEEVYTEYEDNTGEQPGPFFYRIGVQKP